MTRQIMLWPLGVAVGFLALIGVGASVAHYLQEPYNPGFLDFPTIVAVHVVLGGLYLTLAPSSSSGASGRGTSPTTAGPGGPSSPSAWWSARRPCSWAW
jgi:hypothetical protein